MLFPKPNQCQSTEGIGSKWDSHTIITKQASLAPGEKCIGLKQIGPQHWSCYKCGWCCCAMKLKERERSCCMFSMCRLTSWQQTLSCKQRLATTSLGVLLMSLLLMSQWTQIWKNTIRSQQNSLMSRLPVYVLYIITWWFYRTVVTAMHIYRSPSYKYRNVNSHCNSWKVLCCQQSSTYWYRKSISWQRLPLVSSTIHVT